ncbi:MAG: hypothetical protein JWP44_3475 [Mucilaginibacter sp.]|nr:hypothetical protein [Mucilaginibacter sp.]
MKPDNASALFGYILMSIAIISFLVLIVQQEFGRPGQFIPVEIPILFFITMLGFVFIHSELLMDQNNSLSTMRIVVFMMVNIICMLMLKLGWAVNSFALIGLNGTWVTVIGFVFGGKIAQSYIEGKFPPAASVVTPIAGGSGTVGSVTTDTAKLAADQNRNKLQSDYPNINSVSDTIGEVDGVVSPVVAIYVKDSNTIGIPATLVATLAGNNTQNVFTEIITDVGFPRIQSLQSSKMWGSSTPTERGSIGAMVSSTDNENFTGVLTSGHVYSGGLSTNKGGALSGAEGSGFLISNAPAGSWCFQLISGVQDLAVGQIDPNQYTPKLDISFKDGGFYQVGNGDVTKTRVNLYSAVRGARTGYILDYNNRQTLTYNDLKQVSFTNIILIGSSTNRDDSHPVSEGGDSGGCVYVSEGGVNKLVGLILGCDQKFTFVLPVEDTLNDYDFTLL